MRRTGFQTTFLCLLAAFVLSGCNGGSINPFHSSPSDVVKTFFTDCNAGDYSKAQDELSTDVQKLMKDGMGQLAGGVKGVCDKMSKNGTITSVSVTNETIRGEGADVNSRINYKDGSFDLDHEPLIKEKGSWVITGGQ